MAQVQVKPSYNRELTAIFLRKAVFALDSVQRRRHGVYEFNRDPSCIFRIAQVGSPEDRVLSDGILVRRGAPILEIHFWNERIPLMRHDGPDLGWAVRFHTCMRESLQDLAGYLRASSGFDEITAIRGESSFSDWQRYARFYRKFGFEFEPLPADFSVGRIASLSRSLYVWMLIWGRNPASLRGRSLLAATRGQLWMSRSTLMGRYGASE